MALHSESTPDLPSTAVDDVIPSPRIAKSTTDSPVLRPLALKGLGFLRSKSAPPSPRDKNRPSSSASRFRKDTLTTVLDREQDTQISSTVGRDQAGDVTSEATKVEDNSDKTTPPPSDLTHETPPLRKKVPSGIFSPVPNTVGTATSRPTSPVAPFEAFLSNRKRRLNATSKDTGGPPRGEGRPSAIRAGTPSGKSGNKFKSSPLGGGEPAGIVVAEKIKQDMKDKEETVDVTSGSGGCDKKEDEPGYLQH